ncbi:MAG: Ig-like domain-containing protein [Deferrisomatales bacterium]|nr:Ig-like domain-containing protein [Deferrisomatales bacterium]
MFTKKRTFLVLLASLLLLPSFAAAWSSDTTVNTPIAIAPYDQANAVMAADGLGGALIAWTDYRNVSDRDIYAQRVDATGVVQWAVNGVAVCAASNTQRAPRIVSDGSGGAIIAWIDQRSGGDQIYVQRVDSGGTPWWGADGVLVAAAPDTYTPFLRITADGFGGAILVWQDARSGVAANKDVYAQRFDTTGAARWTAGGLPIAASGIWEGYPAVASDGAGGAIVTWTDERGGYGVYAQRVDAAGALQWQTGGMPVAADPVSLEYSFGLVSDGAGGAIALLALADSAPAVFSAQKMDADGVTQWPAPVALTSSYYSAQEVDTWRSVFIGDGLGGAILTWDGQGADPFNELDIYAQRVDTGGVVQWPAGGLPVGSKTYHSGDRPPLASDGAGGFIASWLVHDGVSDTNVFAQRFDAAGLPQWGTEPVAVCTNGFYQADPVTVGDGAGGAIFVWPDDRNGDDQYDLYAHRISAAGGSAGLQTPSNVAPLGGVRIDAASPFTLSASAFVDEAGLVSHAASQWRVHDTNTVTPETPEHDISADDDYFTYPLPFGFPFFERTITAISVNTNGLVELLEDGETDYANDGYGTHSDDEHIDNMDAVFAANDDLDLINGHLRLYNGGTQVVIEWYGATYLDADADPNYPDVTNSLLFQVVLHQDGRITWNFSQLDFTLYDFDLFTGVYPNGGTEIGMVAGGLTAVTTPAAYEFNPATREILPATYAWFTPQPVLYDSGEVADLVDHAVPGTAGLADGVTYYWGVRYRGDTGEWTPWSAPTGFVADLLPPTVVPPTDPIRGAADVAVNAAIRATFSEAMDAASIDGSSFTLTGPGGAGVAGTAGYAGMTATFTPNSDLAFDTTYTATLTAAATDSLGKPLDAPYSWSFTTGAAADATPPAVLSRSPLPDAVDVAIDLGSVSATFSESLDPATVTSDSFTVTGAAGEVGGTVSYDAATHTARFAPAALLAYGTTYTVVLTTDIQDSAGLWLATQDSWTFTTAAEPPPPPGADGVPPMVVSVTPKASLVPPGVGLFTVTFSEAMDASTLEGVSDGSASGAPFTVRVSGGATVTGTVVYDAAALTARFLPELALEYNTTYEATMRGDVTDLAGNAMGTDYPWSFATTSDPGTLACDVDALILEGCMNFDDFTYGTGAWVDVPGITASTGPVGEAALRKTVVLGRATFQPPMVADAETESEASAFVDATKFRLESRARAMEVTAVSAGTAAFGASKIDVVGVPPGTLIPMIVTSSRSYSGPGGPGELQIHDFDGRGLGTIIFRKGFKQLTHMIDLYGPSDDPANWEKLPGSDSATMTFRLPYPATPNNGIVLYFAAGAKKTDPAAVSSEVDASATITFDPPPGVTVTLASGQVFTGDIDTDGDGVADLEDSAFDDATVASPAAATATGSITVDASANVGVSLSQVRALAADDLSVPQAGRPAGLTFPDGLVSFQLNGVTPGGTASVTLIFPTAVPSAVYYKVDGDGFHLIPEPTAIISGDTVTLNLADDGTNGDRVANDGVIQDPGGLAVPVPSSDDDPVPSSDSDDDDKWWQGGCFLQSLE